MDYNEMVKEAYEEIMGFDKEAAARLITLQTDTLEE